MEIFNVIITTIAIIMAVLNSLFIGYNYGEKTGIEKGYREGHKDGMAEHKFNNDDKNFPTTADGRFFSATEAIRTMSVKKDD